MGSSLEDLLLGDLQETVRCSRKPSSGNAGTTP